MRTKEHSINNVTKLKSNLVYFDGIFGQIAQAFPVYRLVMSD